jgi:hypothetical protein
VTTIGGGGTTKAFDLSIDTTPGGTGTSGKSRVFPALNSSYGSGTIDPLPVRITSDTSYYINVGSLDTGSIPSTYGYIMAKRIG